MVKQVLLVCFLVFSSGFKVYAECNDSLVKTLHETSTLSGPDRINDLYKTYGIADCLEAAGGSIYDETINLYNEYSNELQKYGNEANSFWSNPYGYMESCTAAAWNFCVKVKDELVLVYEALSPLAWGDTSSLTNYLKRKGVDAQAISEMAGNLQSTINGMTQEEKTRLVCKLMGKIGFQLAYGALVGMVVQSAKLKMITSISKMAKFLKVTGKLKKFLNFPGSDLIEICTKCT